MKPPIPEITPIPQTREERAAARRQFWKKGDDWALSLYRSWWFYLLFMPGLALVTWFLTSLFVPYSGPYIWFFARLHTFQTWWKMHM